MSAGSERTAIVSLGVSCQSARQIRTSIEILSEALGEHFVPERHFFDGLISPIAGLAQLFEDGFPIFRRQDIAAGPGHPTWQPYGLRFLHHFREEGMDADIDAHFAEDLSRFSYLREKFQRLADRARVVFVISNSQNNLDEVARDTMIADLNFRRDELERLQRAVDRFLGRPCEYLIVSHPDRHGGVDLPELTILEADESEWTGDKSQWRSLFRSYLGRKNIEPFAV
ncbi:hypothetical protein [Roseibium polysiphoniae]|uniref:Papain-like cysteine peptidase DUF1796 n=1 Tax=Roseibium polysiphoniae TaxID=2571221 RepID=A0ABR9CDY5_9HYPH|nr:hypothetical protein [Roseibium polysiphoniae]MBD8878085.1 hypothetical protein [Roseibium polysiphoniae]